MYEKQRSPLKPSHTHTRNNSKLVVDIDFECEISHAISKIHQLWFPSSVQKLADACKTGNQPWNLPLMQRCGQSAGPGCTVLVEEIMTLISVWDMKRNLQLKTFAPGKDTLSVPALNALSYDYHGCPGGGALNFG